MGTTFSPCYSFNYSSSMYIHMHLTWSCMSSTIKLIHVHLTHWYSHTHNPILNQHRCGYQPGLRVAQSNLGTKLVQSLGNWCRWSKGWIQQNGSINKKEEVINQTESWNISDSSDKQANQTDSISKNIEKKMKIIKWETIESKSTKR